MRIIDDVVLLLALPEAGVTLPFILFIKIPLDLGIRWDASMLWQLSTISKGSLSISDDTDV